MKDGNTGDQQSTQEPDLDKIGDDTGQQADVRVVNMPATLFNERLDRAKSGAVNGLLKELGVEDAETLKAQLATLSQLQQEQMTEQEKRDAQLRETQSTIEKLQSDLAQRDEQLLRLDTQLVEQRIDAAILSAAQNATDPQDVLMWSRFDPEHLTGLISEDGKIDDAKVTALVEACEKAKPQFFKRKTPGIPSNANHTDRGVEKPKTRRSRKRRSGFTY